MPCLCARTDLQDFVDALVSKGASGALVEATITPLRAICRRAMSRPESGVVVNPTIGLELPAVRGEHDRTALRDHLDEHLLGLDWREGLVFGPRFRAPLTRTLLSRTRRIVVVAVAAVAAVRHKDSNARGFAPTG